jgi:uncharacterized repeat protein (TIGR01451 family)
MHLPATTALKRQRTRSFCLILTILAGAFLCAALLFSRGSRAATAGHEVPLAPLGQTPAAASDRWPNIAHAFGKLPLSFAANVGQADSRAQFVARGPGYNVFLTGDEAVLVLRAEKRGAGAANAARKAEGRSSSGDVPGEVQDAVQVVRLKLSGANPKAKIEGLDELPGKLNYFTGNDSDKWRTNVPAYSQVKYTGVYRGIDVLYHGNQRQLEYDFLIAPGASPQQIKLTFAGAQKISIDPNGDLILQTPAGNVRQPQPFAYQEFNGARREVVVNYKLKGSQVTFETGAYDTRRRLVIDPAIVYSTFLGGASFDQGTGIAVDAQGSAYVTGYTESTDFPLAGALQGTLHGFNDAFVVKLNPAGTALVYGTYLGGDSDDLGNAIAVDAQGSAYVVGYTASADFAVTAGAFQDVQDGPFADAFVTKLSPSGSSLSYSTFLGGQSADIAYGVAVDAGGRAYVVGTTHSTGFRTVPFPSPRGGSPAHKSTNSAGNWSPIGTGLTPSAVNAIAVAPTNSNTIYAATISGVFKTVDAGAHWNPTGVNNPAIAQEVLYSVAVDPSNSSIVYVGASFSIYKSTDGGTTYTEKVNGIDQVFPVRSLVIDPNTPTTLYAGLQFGGVYKSIDGGDNWVEINNGLGFNPRVSKLIVDPSNTATLYIATTSGMFKTTNGGTSWSSINSGITSNLNMSSVAIDPLHPATLYAGTNFSPTAVFKTINGGASWSPSTTGIPSSNIKALAVDPVTPTTVYAASSRAGILKSIDAGANWTQSNLNNFIANEVVIDRNNPATVYAGVSIGADIFAVRLNSSGTALDYLLNFGGSENDEAHGVAADTDGSAYVTGHTESQNFPVLNAFQAANGGGFGDAFLTKLNPNGSGFTYSTYLGGAGYDAARAVAIRGGSAYVTGDTYSTNFPVVNPIKSAPVNSDADAFVTKFNSSGTSLDFSTWLGGGNFEQAYGIALDMSGNVYVTGLTFSGNFPIVAAPQPSPGGNFDGFVAKLNAGGSALVYSTYLGGGNDDQGNAIAVDALGNAYIVGNTDSTNFPTTPGALKPTSPGGDAFVTKIGVDADLSLTKKESRDPVMVGNPLGYTLIVTNAGVSGATNVTLTDALPAGLTFTSATPTQGTCSFSAPTVTCNLGALSASATVTIVLAVVPNTTGMITNTATVTATETDGNSANNSAGETTKVSASPSINGHVTGASVSGVLMTLSGSQSATTTTDSNGFYQFAELTAGGNFTVTPSKTNLSFSPPARTFNPLNSDQTGDFAASACTFSLAPTSQSFGAGGGSGNVNVVTLQGCSWTAISASSWITINSGASGTGNGTVNFTVSPTTVPRAGHLTIAGQNFAVYQEFNSCGAPGFSVATYNLQSSPIKIRSADLNGDGTIDLVLASGSGGATSVLLNDGNGAFTSSGFDAGLEQQGFVVADFNSDSRPDIAMTSYNFPFVRIFFNNGAGGFGPRVDIPFTSQGQSPLTRELFSSDLNGDGKADLLVATPGTNGLQVMFSNGTGGFTQTAPVGLGTSLGATGLADVNGDSVPDLILSSGNTLVGTLAIMLGNGSGGFGPAIPSAGNDLNTSVPATGDMDGDGKIDIVLAGGTIDSQTAFPAIVVMAGDGAGHFTKKGSFATQQTTSLTVSDLNNDGKLDVAFTQGQNVVTVLPGDGLGGLGSPIQITTRVDNFGSGHYEVVARDFTGDGKADLAAPDYSRGAVVLRNNCAAAPAISGRITDNRTSGGLAGVAITLGPLQVINTQTDSGGNYFIGNLSAGGNYEVIPSKANFKFSPASINVNNLAGAQTANFIGTPTVVQFAQNHYLVLEAAASVQIVVNRTGDLSGATTVNYTTVNGTASDRSDFTAAVGTLHFGPGETTKSFNVLLTDDALVEGFEALRLVLSNPTGALLGIPQVDGFPSDVLMEIQDNDVSGGANPIGNSQFFVRQHYHDFLNREPDAGGLQFWVDQIESCGADAACREVKRINVSGAFFLSIEFQETGYLAYRMYNAAYGETTSPNVAGTVPIVRLQEFLPDTQRIGLGVQVGIGNWQQQLEDNKTAYALEFVQRQRFLTAFPLTMTAAEFVAKLDQNTNGVLSVDDKAQLLAMLGATPADAAKRASVVRRVADDSELRQRELNRAFVLMQYYGYLRRNPDDPQDTDFRGWKFWQDKLNQFNGNFVQAEMVKSFLVAGEYRQRFGTP